MAKINFDKAKDLASSATKTVAEVGGATAKKIGSAIGEAGKGTAKKAKEVASGAVEGAEELKEKLAKQKKEIEEKGFSESAYEVTQNAMTKAAALPVVRVDREEFLRKTFGNSKYIDKILADGPQSVYTVDSLRKKADEVIRSSTRKTSAVSFAAGLPSNPALMIAAGAADVTQYFGFALNLAQKIAYIFGEDQIFNDKEDLISKNGEAIPEDAQVRMIAYIGGMMGVSGASGLIIKTSQAAGANIGKKVAGQALTKTTWYPIAKKVGSILGYKITKKTVESVISKAVPVIGGAISGGITYVTFKPMGRRLADVFVKYLNGDYDIEMELNPEFAKSIENLDEDIVEVADAEFIDVDDAESEVIEEVTMEIINEEKE